MEESVLGREYQAELAVEPKGRLVREWTWPKGGVIDWMPQLGYWAYLHLNRDMAVVRHDAQ